MRPTRCPTNPNVFRPGHWQGGPDGPLKKNMYMECSVRPPGPAGKRGCSAIGGGEVAQAAGGGNRKRAK